MRGFQTIRYSKSGEVAYISLNRPEVHNAYNVQMRDELYLALEAVKDDPDVGVAILKGEGPSFCAGADLTEFGTAPSLAIAREVRWERDIWGMFFAIPKPVIASIHGYCLGSGVEMALLCDIRIAAEGTVFGMPEVSLGMIPAAGGTQTIPRTLGIPKALELLLTRRRFGAPEALEWGLATKVVAGGSLASETEATAQQLLSMDRKTLMAVKEAVLKGSELPLERGLELEARLTVRTLATRRG